MSFTFNNYKIHLSTCANECYQKENFCFDVNKIIVMLMSKEQDFIFSLK
jgi:hypothetical protein